MTKTPDTATLDTRPATFESILDEVDRGERDHLDRVVRAAEALRVAEVEMREALTDIDDGAGPAWVRYAHIADAAMVDMEIELGIAAATLKATSAETREEVHHALEHALVAVRARLDDVRVRAHLGQLDLRDLAGRRADAVDAAVHQIAEVLSSAEHDAGASLSLLRETAEQSIGELRHSMAVLLDAVRPTDGSGR